MAVRKLKKSWQYDFKISGHPRQRKGGFRTKTEAEMAERRRREQLFTGAQKVLCAEAFDLYMAAERLKDRTRDSYEFLWGRIKMHIGHLYVEDVDTSTLDAFKQTLPKNLGPNSVNHYLAIIKAVLRFMWKCGKLKHVPYVSMESIPRKNQDWYTQEERDRLLDGMFRWYPQWYLFFYLTCRLGLRCGEMYAMSHRQIRHIRPQLVIDQALQREKKRPAMLMSRKNNEAYVFDVTHDVLDAIR